MFKNLFNFTLFPLSSYKCSFEAAVSSVQKKALIIAPLLHILEHCGPINCVPRGGLAIIANNCKKDDQKSWALVLDAMHKGQG